jgi:hypothetical protein
MVFSWDCSTSLQHPRQTLTFGPDLFNRLADEFAERYRRGERPALSEYVDKDPELADKARAW